MNDEIKQRLVSSNAQEFIKEFDLMNMYTVTTQIRDTRTSKYCRICCLKKPLYEYTRSDSGYHCLDCKECLNRTYREKRVEAKSNLF